MNVTVRLRRNRVLRPTKHKPIIKGHIVGSGGVEGGNILRPGIRDIDQAKASACDFCRRTMGHLGEVKISFQEV